MRSSGIRLAVGLLLAGTLAGVPAASAGDCPYTTCWPPGISITVTNAPVLSGGTARICVRHTYGSEVRGSLDLTVERRNGDFRWDGTKPEAATRTCVRTPEVTKPGPYLVRAYFHAPADGEDGDSANATVFVVRRR